MIVRELLTVLGFKVDSSGAEKFNGVINNTKKLILGVSAATTFLGGVFLKGAGDMEQVRIAFETMTGSAEVANKLIQDLTKFAARTPFQLTGLIQSSKKLLAFGFTADEIVQKMTYLGNISAGVGREKLPSIILAFGKIRTKGKATMEELNILLEAGVPILDELAKKFQVSTKEIAKMVSAGTIGFDDVDTAMRNLGTGSGRFGGLMERQSKSFLGIVSNIFDFFERLRNEIGGEIIDDAKTIAYEFLQWAEANQEIIKGGIVAFLRGFAFAVAVVLVIVQRLVKRIVGFAKILGGLFGVIKNIIKFFVDWRDILIPIGIILGAYVATLALVTNATALLAIKTKILAAATKAWAAVQGAINAIMAANPIALMVAGIVALIVIIVLLVKHWDKISAILLKFGKETLKFVQDKIETFIKFAEKLFTNFVKNLIMIWNDFSSFFIKLWENISSLVLKIWDNIVKKVTNIVDKVKKVFEPITDFFKEVLKFFQEFKLPNILGVKTKKQTTEEIFSAPIPDAEGTGTVPLNDSLLIDPSKINELVDELSAIGNDLKNNRLNGLNIPTVSLSNLSKKPVMNNRINLNNEINVNIPPGTTVEQADSIAAAIKDAVNSGIEKTLNEGIFNTVGGELLGANV